MHTELLREISRDRARQQREYVRCRRLETRLRRARRDERGSTWRARLVRHLFAAAFALDARESWRQFWDRMSGGNETGRIEK